jgi:hypothetical protein
MRLAGQVGAKNFPGQWQVVPFFAAHAFAPSATYGRQPTSLAGTRVLPPNGIDVRPGGEQLSEEVNLYLRW